MTDLELAANEEARHGNRDALESLTAMYNDLLMVAAEAGAVDPEMWKLNTDSD